MEALYCLLYCCKKKKRRVKKARRSKQTKYCFFCDTGSDDVINICQKVGYHKECLENELAVRATVSIACNSADCTKNQNGLGHTKTYTRVSRWRFEGKWRETCSNLLAFFGISCLMIAFFGGNRQSGAGAAYNWIPVAIIYALVTTNVSHLIAFGVKLQLSDLWALLWTGIGSFIIYFNYIPHIVEFVSGVTITTILSLFFMTLFLMLKCCGNTCKCCLNSFKTGIQEETYEEIGSD